MRHGCEYVQSSLLSILNKEHELVSKLNEINQTIGVAKSANLRTNEYLKRKDSIEKELTETRNEIREYIVEKIGLGGTGNE